jgi:hypothetical protein
MQQGLGCGGQIINEIGTIGLLVRATDKTKANLIPTESNTHLNSLNMLNSITSLFWCHDFYRYKQLKHIYKLSNSNTE